MINRPWKVIIGLYWRDEHSINTFKDNYIEVWATAFRDEVQAITVDASTSRSLKGNLKLSRRVIQDENNLLYMNLEQQDGTDNQILYYQNKTAVSLSLSAPNMPDFEILKNNGENIQLFIHGKFMLILKPL